MNKILKKELLLRGDAKLNYFTKSTLGEWKKFDVWISKDDDSSSLKMILVDLLECKLLTVDYEDVEEKANDDLMVMVVKTFAKLRGARNIIFTSGVSH